MRNKYLTNKKSVVTYSNYIRANAWLASFLFCSFFALLGTPSNVVAQNTFPSTTVTGVNSGGTASFAIPADGLECTSGNLELNLSIDGGFAFLGGTLAVAGPGIAGGSTSIVAANGCGGGIQTETIPLTEVSDFNCDAGGGPIVYTFTFSNPGIGSCASVNATLGYQYWPDTPPFLENAGANLVYAGTSINDCISAAPAFSATKAIMGYADANCTGTITATETGGPATATGDDCSWSITYTYDVTDACGNVLSGQTYTEMGGDLTAPTLTGTAYSQVGSINDCIANAPPFDSLKAIIGYTDNCGGTVIATETGGPAVATGNDCSWTITYMYSVQDSCSNVLSGLSYTETGGDLDAPSLTGTAYTQVGSINDCIANAPTFDASKAKTGYTDDCGGTVTATEMGTAVATGDDCLWSITFTYLVQDSCLNVLDSLTYTEMGGDLTAPTLTGTAYSQVGSINDCIANAPTFDSSKALMGYTDDCGGTVTTSEMGTAVATGDDCSWSITFTYLVQDSCLNVLDSLSYTEMGGDLTAPTLTGTAYSQVGSINDCIANAPPFDASKAIIGYTDNCGGTVTATETGGPAVATGDDCLWSITYMYSVQDSCSNVLSGLSYTETGGDTEDPIAMATIDSTVLTNTGLNGAAAANTAVVVDGGCDIVMNATDFINTSTDNCTPTDSLTVQIRNPNNNSPGGNGPGAGPWGASATFTEGNLGGSNNDFNFNIACFTTFRLQYRVIDQCGLISDPIDIIIPVVDEEAPTFPTPTPDFAKSVGACDATIDVVVPFPADNCGNGAISDPVLTVSDPTANVGPATPDALTGTISWSVSTLSVGNWIGTVTATDPCGNIGIDTFNIVITDDTPPSANCFGDISVDTDAGTCDASVSYFNATSTDNCETTQLDVTFAAVSGDPNPPANFPADFQLIGGAAPGGQPITNTFDKGVTEITYTFSDDSATGNPASCTQLVTITDAEDPTIANALAPTVQYNTSQGVDCPLVRTGGSAGVASFITANGGLPIEIPAPGYVDLDLGGGIMYTTLGHADFADNCPVENGTLTITALSSNNNGCDEEISVTYTYVDCGATTQASGTTPIVQSQVVTISDDEDPEFVNPMDVTITTKIDGASCPSVGVTGISPGVVTSGATFMVSGKSYMAPVLGSLGTTTPGEYADNCQATPSLELVSITPGGDDCTKTYELLWRVSDGCGNSTDQTQMFTVIDDTEPTPVTVVPAEYSVDVNCMAEVTAAQIAGASTDNCTMPAGLTIGISTTGTLGDAGTMGAPVTSVTLTASFLASCPQSQNVYLHVWDACGNEASTLQAVALRDTTPPTAVTISPAEYPVDASCMAVVSASDIAGVSTDNCSLNSAIGISTTGVLGDAGLMGSPTGSVTLTADFSASCPQMQTVYLHVWDDCGNEDTQAQMVTLRDVTPPTAVTVAPAEYAIDANCMADVNASDIAGASTDNCALSSAIGISTTGALGDAGMMSAPTGTVTLTADFTSACPQDQTVYLHVWDECGNEDTQAQIVQLRDYVPPTAVTVAPAAPYAVDASCQADVMASEIAGISTDNCQISSVIGISTTGNLGDAGLMGAPTTTVTLTGDFSSACPQVQTVYLHVWDECGNEDTQAQDVQLEDVTAPMLTAPSVVNQTFCNTAGDCNQSVFITCPSATDNCDPLGGEVSDINFYDENGMSLSIGLPALPQPLLNGSIPNSFSFDFSVGVTTVELVVSDQCDNTSVQTYMITILDCDAPVATNCPPSTINADVSDDGMGDCATDVTWTNPDFADNCLSGEMTLTFIDPGTNSASYALPSGLTGAGPHKTYAGMAGFLADETYNFFHGTTKLEITYTDAGPGGQLVAGVAMPALPQSTTCYVDIVVADDEVPTLETAVTTPNALSTTAGSVCPAAAAVTGVTAGSSVAFGAPFSVAGVSGFTAPAATDFTDNCPDAQLSVVSITPSGDACNAVITIEWLYEDCGGNPIPQTQVFNIADDSTPTLTGTLPASTGINACYANAVTASAFDMATVLAQYTDDKSCQTLTLANLVSTPSGDDCSWTVTHTFDILDGCGNDLIGESYMDSGSNQNVPTLTGTMPVGVTGVDACMDRAAIRDIHHWLDDIAALEAVYTAECGEPVTAKLVVQPSGFSQEFAPGDTNCSWTLTRHFSVEDGCGLLAAGPITIVYSGGDDTGPMGSAPSGTADIDACLPTQSDADALFTASMPAILSSHYDVCGPTPLVAANIINNVSVVVAGSTDCSWTVEHTYDVVDACGNVLTGMTFSDSGYDQVSPTFDNNEPDQNLDAQNLECGIDVFIQKPLGSDNCNTAVADSIWADVNGVGINFGDLGTQWNAQFPVGVTDVIIRMSDECGNASLDSLVITVNDVTAPIFSTGCPADITVDTAVPCNSEASFNIPSVLEACGVFSVDVSYSGNPILPPASSGLSEGATVTEIFGFGVTTVTLTATDNQSLSSTCSFTVTSDCSNLNSNCVDTLYVSSADILTFGPSALFKSNDLTYSDAFIATGSNIEYYSGNTVELNPGFEVELGAEFLADIADCFTLPGINAMINTDDQSGTHSDSEDIDNKVNDRMEAIIQTYKIDEK